MERRRSPSRRVKHVRFTEIPDSKPRESMASWFERQVSSHQVQLAGVAVLSGIAVAGTIYGTQAILREKRVEELKASIPELNESHHADNVG